MSSRSWSSKALVVKRQNVGEADRLLTLLTREQGKIAVVAKGVRQLRSTQRAALEPGNYVQVFCVTTKSLPLLTQTRLLDDFIELRTNLLNLKKITGILEMIDRLFVEAPECEIFDQIIELLQGMNTQRLSHQLVQEKLNEMLMQLGYADMHTTTYRSISAYVAAVAERPLRSYEYLTLLPAS